MKLLKKVKSFFKDLLTPRKSYYSTELIAEILEKNSQPMWKSECELTPEQLKEWKELSTWSTKTNLPKTWTINIKKEK